ncbi:hypothetical protein [Neobacillus vireti]|uniref:hypothetical protein n=1 Tax=Neobacillus vireti TaxID=220686 RepID=UPI002FFEA2A1
MDGKYLASNFEALKVLGDGKVFVTVNDLLNSNRFENVELVAYSIDGTSSEIVNVECLFRHTKRDTMYFRDFDFYKNPDHVSDNLKRTADYGRGFADYDLYRFIKLRDFYLQSIEIKA